MSISQNFPVISPSLSLNFARSKTLDPRITFTRTTSATRLNDRGLIEVVPANLPRFDHLYDATTGTVRSLGLLIEESRANQVIYSEDISQWTQTNVTVSSNVEISPDGTQTADKVIENITSLTKEVARASIQYTSGTYLTFSAFVKYAGRNTLRFAGNTPAFSGTGTGARFNVLTGQVTDFYGGVTSAYMIPYPNGWYRCVAIMLPTATINSAVYLTLSDGTNAGYTGDGTSGLYIWGAQVEVGTYPSSYIPTVASTVGKTPDNVTITGTNFSDMYSQSEGTISVAFRGKTQDTLSYDRVYSVNTGTPSFEEILLFYNVGYDPDRIGYLTYDNGVALQDTTGTAGGYVLPSSSTVKTAMCYQSGSYAYVFNGQTPITGSPSGVPTTTIFDIGRVGAGSYLNGTISQLSYYPKRVTNSQLQNLTL